MAERQLAADEAELLGEVRPRAGRVAAKLVVHRAADEAHHRLAAQPPEQVPEARSTAEIALTARPLRP